MCYWDRRNSKWRGRSRRWRHGWPGSSQPRGRRTSRSWYTLTVCLCVPRPVTPSFYNIYTLFDPQQLRAYAVQEERGFSLYTFVNQAQRQERKALEAEINALRAEWVRSVL